MANLGQLIPALFTGKGGELLTPEQIKRRQDLANSAMAFATDSSPNAGGVASILAKGLAGFRAGYENNRAEAGIQAASKENQSLISNLLSGLGGTGGVSQGATVASPTVAPVQNVAPASIPQSADAGVIRQGLIDRGLPSHVADAFVVNFQDESGLNPGINEAAPIVPGSRGGFGLYQLTGPRRTAYEAYAKERGVSPDNVDAQLDWLKYELDGPEAKAAGTILSAPDTATAAQAIVKNFLRPAPEHQQRRSAAYAGLSTQPQQDMGIEGALAASNTSAFPPAPTAGGSGINPAIVAALSSPVANAQTQNVAGLLLNQQFSQQESAQKLALAQAQRQQEIARRQQIARQAGIDPAYAQDDELWKGATGNLFAAPSTTTVGNSIIDNRTGQPIYQGAPERQPLMNLGDGTVYDPNAPQDQRFIQAPNGSRGFRQANADEIKAYGTNGQVGPDGKFYPITPPQGTALSVDPTTGAVTFNQGAGVKPLTEVQSKDSFFTTRMTAANPTLEANEDALLSLGEKAAGAAPLGMGNYLQSEQYQLARDAGRDFVTAYLRKDSGAALTPAEERLYGELLLPQPGDKTATIELKRQRRQVAVEAIKSGIPPQAVDGVLKAIKAVPGAETPTTPSETPTPSNGSGWREVLPGIRIRPKGGN